jgi:alanyl-tRNA synthetase
VANQRPIAADDIRKAYLNFFQERGHLVVPSASLIPAGDPTLLLTSAGMVPFKSYFIGDSEPPQPLLTSSQKCFRASDIDEVGDTTHLTFFEMLGNFSIGDYFKQGAIEYAWEFVTQVLELPLESLWATVYLEDDEAHDLWVKTGVPTERIRRFGNKDNYWGPPGEEGPCGPCSEIHYDFGGTCRLGKSEAECGPNCECGRFLELWNLVFMQFYQDVNGDKKPLTKGNIDTGMGLERAALILQNAKSLYETDLLKPILDRAAEIAGITYGRDEAMDVALRVVAEHARSATFLIADGVVPGNEGRSYVLRSVIRRGIRYARKLGIKEPYMERMSEAVIDRMRVHYPELTERKKFILRALELEEERFQQAIDIGMPLLEQELVPLHLTVAKDSSMGADSVDALSDRVSEAVRDRLTILLKDTDGIKVIAKTITGAEAFFLYDSYGFPFELTQEIAQEHGLGVDVDGFNAEMEAQRERGRAAARFGGGRNLHRTYDALGANATSFLGYEQLAIDSVVVGMLVDGQPVAKAFQGMTVEVVLRETPFYAEGGGQVGDTGVLEAQRSKLRVTDTQKPVKDIIVHTAIVEDGRIAVGDNVHAAVDVERRHDIARNHTATHMLHAALRQVLGAHVRQAGSLVTPDRLRFDFTHVAGVTPEELYHVQRMVNEAVRENLSVGKRETTYRDAVKEGALAFFGEQYGDRVRVVMVGQETSFSFEVCGGTHVDRSGDLGYVHVLSESGIGTGMRRIEAVTGRGADDFVSQRLTLLDGVASQVHAAPGELSQRLDALLEEVEQSRKEAASTQRENSHRQAENLLAKVQEVNGIKMLVTEAEVSSVEALREMGDWLRDKLGSGIVALGSVVNGKPNLVVMVTQDLVAKAYHAGETVKAAASVIGGGGGGRPDVAQAGGRQPGKLSEALQTVVDFIKSKGG